MIRRVGPLLAYNNSTLKKVCMKSVVVRLVRKHAFQDTLQHTLLSY